VTFPKESSRQGEKMAAELILHHYDFSNYSEKVRLVLGLKGLSWRSVDIPPVLPKYDTTP
jgi:Glutathione S-transferase, N-terminal domain